MLDAQSLAQLVQDQLQQKINQEVENAMSQKNWLEELETQIIQHVQDRITARFSNIETVPDLVKTVERSVTNIFDQGFVPDISGFVNQDLIKRSLDFAVEKYISSALESLMIDPLWLRKIEIQVEQQVSEKVKTRLREVDINLKLTEIVLSNKDQLLEGLRKEFETPGMFDRATRRQLSVVDDVVVIENELIAKNLTITEVAHLPNAVITNLAVKGTINTDNRAWDELKNKIAHDTMNKVNADLLDAMTDQVLARAKTSGIEFAEVKIAGEVMINKGVLSNKIIGSNLQSLGELKNLTVIGPSSIYDTVNVLKKRVGINTAEPEMALSIWDEETNVVIGKHGEKTAYIGSGRSQNLAIGVNRIPAIEINDQGLVTIKTLRVGKHKISHSDQVPGYSGTKGDIVFNNNYATGKPFAWVCVGGYNWAGMKSA